MKNTIRFKSMQQQTSGSGARGLTLALALGLSGVLAAESYIIGTQSAVAGPAQVEEVQIADFSGIVKSVSPAVVSVKTRTGVKVTRSHDEFFKGMPGFGFIPNAHSEFEFYPDGPGSGMEGEHPNLGMTPHEFAFPNGGPHGLPGMGAMPHEFVIPDGGPHGLPQMGMTPHEFIIPDGGPHGLPGTGAMSHEFVIPDGSPHGLPGTGIMPHAFAIPNGGPHGLPGTGTIPDEFIIPDGGPHGLPGTGVLPHEFVIPDGAPHGLPGMGMTPGGTPHGVPGIAMLPDATPQVIPGMKGLPENTPGFTDHPKGFPDLANLPGDHPLMLGVDKFGDEPGVNRPGTKTWSYSSGQGSGFFISGDGFVVTNEHVVRDANEIKVVTDSGETYDAELIGVDVRTDLALLKVDADKEFTYVEFADDDPEVGEWVVTVGNPFGLGGTVTAGIVSARGRDIGSGPYDDYIQIDAPVNNGNSGGPAFNLSGKVIGVNTAIFSPSGGNVGIAFAIPAATTEDVVMDLMDDGTVARGWLGVHVQNISDDIADSIGLDEATGALITEPQPDSPATEAGLQSGDAILWVNTMQIKSPRDLAKVIAAQTPGTEVELTILRDGSEKTVFVELGQLPSDPANNDKVTSASGNVDLSSLGLEVASAKESGKADEGVVIVAVKPGSTAESKNLRKGTVILEVAGETVNSPADVAARIGEAQAEGRSAVLLRLQFEDGTRFVALPIERT